jgi:hypothetical protein
MRSVREGPVLKEKIVAIMGPPLHHSHSVNNRGSTRFRAVRRKGGGRGERSWFRACKENRSQEENPSITGNNPSGIATGEASPERRGGKGYEYVVHFCHTLLPSSLQLPEKLLRQTPVHAASSGDSCRGVERRGQLQGYSLAESNPSCRLRRRIKCLAHRQPLPRRDRQFRLRG